MDKERVKKYILQAYENPENPIRVARIDEGQAVYSRLLYRMEGLALIVLPGVIYIAPSAAAVEEILRRLSRELIYYSDTENVPEKVREIRENIKGIEALGETNRKYVSRNAVYCR